MNPVLPQSNSILSFLYDFDLLAGDNIFAAEIDFILNGKRKIGEAKVRVKFSSTDNHAILTLSTKQSGAIFPVVLNSREHTFTYIPGVTLQVEGTDKNPFIGKFRLSIFPKNGSLK